MISEDGASEANELERQKQIWRKEQEIVASRVEIEPDPSSVFVEDYPSFRVLAPLDIDGEDCYYGGVDVGFPIPAATNSNSHRQLSVAVYVIVHGQTLEVVYRDHEWYDADAIPYVSTYLAFREIEPLQRLIEKQTHLHSHLTPKAILVDGNGFFHPRSAGIACFVGTRTGIPTIGIGKTLLYIGDWTREKLSNRVRDVLASVRAENRNQLHDDTKGLGTRDQHGLIWSKPTVGEHNCNDKPTNEEILRDLASFCSGIAIPLANGSNIATPLGAALLGHGKAGTKTPIIVSVGHGLSLAQALQITARLSLHRIPEPVRHADLYGRKLIRQEQQKQQHENK